MANWKQDGNGIHRLNLGAYRLSLVEKHVHYPDGIWVMHLLPGLIDTEPIGKFSSLADAKIKAIEIAKGKLKQVYDDAMAALG